MLERFEQIQGIGLLHDARGERYKCAKLTLIYADNGRGKSTIAAILRSLATDDPKPINDLTTIDGTLRPKAVIQFESGRKATFDNGAWSGAKPDILVFDADFIARNVHSGGEVKPDHRKNLLEFALGEGAVTARKAEAVSTERARNASELIADLTRQLAPLHTAMSLPEFEQLPKPADADAGIADIEQRLSAARNAATIKQRPVPQEIPLPPFDPGNLFACLAKTLQHVHSEAESLVRKHLQKLASAGAESWIETGTKLADGRACPYCGLPANDLVRAYQSHFDAAYKNLKTEIAKLRLSCTDATAAAKADIFAGKVSTASAQAAAWAQEVPTQPIEFDAASARETLAKLQLKIINLLEKKASAPAEPVGSKQDRDEITALWQQSLAYFAAANTAIKLAADSIKGYLNTLDSADAQQLQKDLDRTKASKLRHGPATANLVSKLRAARSEKQAADAAKASARKTLNALMGSTLSNYEASINKILADFGASFRIVNMSPNFFGSAPHSQYAIELRQKPVKIDGDPPCFATALSDGDKRTLAFAFFIARALSDPKLADKIVLIDDPMSSLDENRRLQTLTYLQCLHSKAQQLITTAHDARFLRDLRDTIEKASKGAATGQLQLVATTGQYTDFCAFNVDDKCEADYCRLHRTLSDYVDGKSTDSRAAAEAIRPALEAYLDHRFPNLLRSHNTLGAMILAIEQAQPPSPLVYAKGIIAVLSELKEFGWPPHHPASDNAPSPPTDTAVRSFAVRTLHLIHSGAA